MSVVGGHRQWSVLVLETYRKSLAHFDEKLKSGDKPLDLVTVNEMQYASNMLSNSTFLEVVWYGGDTPTFQ